jgi:hypothetical protein
LLYRDDRFGLGVLAAVMATGLLAGCGGGASSSVPTTGAQQTLSSGVAPVALSATVSRTAKSAITVAATSNNVLASGSQLTVGQSLQETVGGVNAYLTLESNGNLILYTQSGQEIWDTNTTSGQSLRMQTDGNLVLYNGSNAALWASGTAGRPGASLTLQGDGNMVISSSGGTPIWTSDTQFGVDLASPNQLSGSQTLQSPNGQWKLAIISGNLRLYYKSILVWPITNTSTATSLRMQQSDGNLVLYDGSNHPLWATGTNHDPGAFFYLQDNGTMTVVTCKPNGGGYLDTTGVSGCVIGNGNIVWQKTEQRP